MDNNLEVAIVDDEPVLVRTYELVFKRRHIPVSFCAYDGEEAIAKFKNASPRPKVVIIDYRMKSMTGIDVLKAIIAEEPRTKILFISGDAEARKLSLDAGADLFLKKPARIREIMEAINTLMAEP
jgi:two-component system chemotaxis response regulator CheY